MSDKSIKELLKDESQYWAHNIVRDKLSDKLTIATLDKIEQDTYWIVEICGLLTMEGSWGYLLSNHLKDHVNIVNSFNRVGAKDSALFIESLLQIYPKIIQLDGVSERRDYHQQLMESGDDFWNQSSQLMDNWLNLEENAEEKLIAFYSKN